MAIRNLFRNKYPYTDFHELNLSWVLDTVTSTEDTVRELDRRLDSAEANITDNKARLTAAEGMLTDAEGRITTAEARITYVDNRVTSAISRISSAEDTIDALESRLRSTEQTSEELRAMDMLNATYIQAVGNVTADQNSVKIPFDEMSYVNGNETTGGTVQRIIPAATFTTAGVMKPDEKAILGEMTLDNDGNIRFDSRVMLDTGLPIYSDEAVTKEYVDNLSITGGASASSPTVLSGSGWQNTTYATHRSGWTSGRSYGQMRRIEMYESFDIIDNVSAGSIVIAEAAITPGYSTGSSFQRTLITAQVRRGTTYMFLPLLLQVSQNSILIQSVPGATLQSGDEVLLEYSNITYIAL